MSTATISREQTPEEQADSDGIECPPTDGSDVSPPPTPSPVESENENRPLDVTEALAYLDALKTHFSSTPEVYNRFLDIMKEFKNEQCVARGGRAALRQLMAEAQA